MIDRNPIDAAGRDYDLIVVGGGIHGCMTLLHAALAGHRALLLERADFGGATSFNSLRIVHGGLRYLQTLDLIRFFESVRERRWYARVFPDLVRPLPCLMPLYNSGLKRTSVMRVALALNDVLSIHRNRGLRSDGILPKSQIVSANRVKSLCPFVLPDDLAGGAVWYDACIPDSHRVVMETLRWATSAGAVALNYMQAKHLDSAAGTVCRVEAYDHIDNRTYRFRAPAVINAAGPWCDEVLQNFGQSQAAPAFSIAWNILFDKPATIGHAVALTAPARGAQTYFLHPWNGRLLVGTGHCEWTGDCDGAKPGGELLNSFIEEINAAAPGLELAMDNIAHVFTGLLPATRPGSAELSRRPTIVDHGRRGGPNGLVSMVGIKFTTAHDVALRALRTAGLRTQLTASAPNPPPGAGQRNRDLELVNGTFAPGDLEFIDSLAASEAVCNAEDLVYRRTSLGSDPAVAQQATELIDTHLRARQF